jgi:hypothetical protein
MENRLRSAASKLGLAAQGAGIALSAAEASVNAYQMGQDMRAAEGKYLFNPLTHPLQQGFTFSPGAYIEKSIQQSIKNRFGKRKRLTDYTPRRKGVSMSKRMKYDPVYSAKRSAKSSSTAAAKKKATGYVKGSKGMAKNHAEGGVLPSFKRTFPITVIEQFTPSTAVTVKYIRLNSLNKPFDDFSDATAEHYGRDTYATLYEKYLVTYANFNVTVGNNKVFPHTQITTTTVGNGDWEIAGRMYCGWYITSTDSDAPSNVENAIERSRQWKQLNTIEYNTVKLGGTCAPNKELKISSPLSNDSVHKNMGTEPDRIVYLALWYAMKHDHEHNANPTGGSAKWFDRATGEIVVELETTAVLTDPVKLSVD